MLVFCVRLLFKRFINNRGVSIRTNTLVSYRLNIIPEKKNCIDLISIYKLKV